jgi:putative DNA primase/helicase
VAYSWAGSRNELKRLFGKLKGLMEAKPRTSDRDPQELAPVALPLTLEAQSLAVEAGNIFESLMAPGNDLAELRDRGSKALENACRIAGVLAVVEGGMATREISRSNLERGVNLIQWYLNEALRIRSAAVVPQSVIDAESMLAWLKDRDCKVFRTATLLTHGPSQLRNKKRLDDAIDEAVKCGYLTEQDPGAVVDGVRAKRSWRVLHYVV